MRRPNRFVGVIGSAGLVLGSLTLAAATVPPAAASAHVTSAPVTSEAIADSVSAFSSKRTVAPGIEVDEVQSIDPRTWQIAHTLTVDLSSYRIGYLDPGSVAATAPLPLATDREGAIAAVNGDFFDINNSGAPVGGAVANGVPVKSPSAGRNRAVGFGADGLGRILDLQFQGAVGLPSGTRGLDRLNSHDLPVDGIGAYTAKWGTATRARAVLGATEVAEALVVDGKVQSVSGSAGAGAIPAGATVLLGREAGAAALNGLQIGDPVTIDHKTTASDGKDILTAVGGGALLVKDGVVQEVDDSGPPYPARTAIGFTKDGKRMVVISVDGPNTTHSRGGTLKEMGRLLVERGAYTGMELDGGGSSTLLARTPGSDKVTVENSPNDGNIRAVSNGLGVFPRKAGSGRTTGLHVRTAIEPKRAAGDAVVPGGRPDRAFVGLARSMTAVPHDELLGPVTDKPTAHWTATAGRMDGSTFRAYRPGTATIRAFAGRAHGDANLEVLTKPVRISASTPAVNLASASEQGSVAVIGFDAHGNSAPIEPADVSPSYDKNLLSLTPNADGGFAVAARKETGAGLITLQVGDLTTVVAVSVGVEKHVVGTFDDADSWTVGGARSTYSREKVADGGHDGAALKLKYDFATSTATRTAYVTSPVQLGKPGKTRAVGAMVYGNGKGEWTAFRVRDAQGRSTSLYGPYITWTGWRELEVAIPEGMPQPVTVDRFTAIEISASKQYQSEILLDDMYVKVAPAVEPPTPPQVKDRLVDRAGDTGKRDWRFAVMSDSQFVARDPDSPWVQAARRTLREIKASDAEFLVIAGDFVDEATKPDFELAKRILDEELAGEFPYVYVPGNHEIMGGPIDNFKSYFGATHQTFDHKGTRFITLDSSTGSLQGGGFDQIAMFRQSLDAAAKDPKVRSVILVEHHPTRDPSVNAVSQLPHRRDAHLIESWLADFQHSTGKGAAFIGAHVGKFHAYRTGGIPFLINGNSGKAPSSDVSDGGFTGWSMMGVDRVSEEERLQAKRFPYLGGPSWLTAELRAHVDSLTITAPATITVGATENVKATVVQGQRQVPAVYPMSTLWTGSPNVHIGPAKSAKPWHVAAFDPATGKLTGLRSGTAKLSIKVNGVVAKATVEVNR